MPEDSAEPAQLPDPRLSDPQTEATVDALLETVRGLLADENARDQSFILRGVGIAALVGVIGSLSIALGRDALRANWGSPWKGIAVLLFALALLALLGAAGAVLLRVLQPRDGVTLAMSEIERYELPEYVFAPKVMNQGKTLRGLVEALGIQRTRVNGKASGLTYGYRLLGVGLSAIALLGFLLGLHDGRLIGVPSARTRAANARTHLAPNACARHGAESCPKRPRDLPIFRATH